MAKLIQEIPPANAKRVYRWTDLPNCTEPAVYRVTDTGREPRDVIVSNHQRQVLEGLIRGPIFAASYCRISDQVLPLRRDHGINIKCEMYRNDPETGRSRFGVYYLISKVEHVNAKEAA